MTNMTGFGSVDEPRQFTKFLSKRLDGEPEFSLANAQAAALPAGQGWRERIDTAHRDEHGRFVYVTDKEGDVWTMPRWHWIWSTLSEDWRWVAEGDCEDWALYMVTVLLALDVPAGALRLAECRIPGGQGHAVLTIETEDTTLVSDVRQTGVPEWDSPLFQGYEWLFRQVPGRSAWTRIGNAPTLADLLGGQGGGA
jgi:hypothetical protein